MVRLRVQLVALVVLTVAGVGFIGLRYGEAGRFLGRGGYTVTVHLADSGGIFSGADVTYRGVSVGRVRTMTLTADGVDVQAEIDRATRIPADTLAVVANKPAVGEQHLDFQPRRDDGPVLGDGSEIAQESTRVPLRTDALLTSLDGLVASVSTDDLRTVVDELGVAFADTGPHLQRILETSSAFIATAQEKYDVTAELIRASTTVLQTQIDSGVDIASFVGDLHLLSRTLRGSDADLRTVLSAGPPTAETIRQVIAENSSALGRLVRQLVTTNRVVRAHLPGVRGVLVLAPYGLEGAYSIIAKDPVTGLYGARFSLALQAEPGICTRGKPVRTPFDTAPADPATGADTVAPCTEPVASTGPDTETASRVVGTYDERSRRLVPAAGSPSASDVDASNLGSESWKWMLLGSAATR